MRKKLLFLIPSLDTGGAERALINLLNAIPESKYEIDICIVLNQGFYLDKIPQHVNKIILFKYPIIGRILNYVLVKFRKDALIKSFVNRLLKKRYDVGISFADSSYTHLLTLIEKRPEKLITWLHSSPASYSNYSKFYTKDNIEYIKKNRYSKMNSIVFVSNDSLQEFRSILEILKT